MLSFMLSTAFTVRPSIVYGVLRWRISEIVPLNKLLGIEIISVGDGVAEARVPFRPDVTNHIGTMHATAIFGVAEAASGGAMSGALAPVVAQVRPVAAAAHVHFTKAARSGLIARAKAMESSEALRRRLADEGKVAFDVDVDVYDEAGAEIAKITVTWHVTMKQQRLQT